MLFPVGASDPNWFYSTLAQATAAIVGLAGGFMLQRVLAQRQEIVPVRTGLRKDCETLLGRINDEYGVAVTVLESVESATREAEEHEQAGSGPYLGRSVRALDVSGFDEGDEPPGWDSTRTVPVLRDAREWLRRYVAACEDLDLGTLVEQVRKEGEIGSAEVVLGPLDANGPVVPMRSPPTVWELLERQGGMVSSRWEGYRARSTEIGADLRAMQATLVPASLYFLFVVLGALLGAGVIAPIVFLSGGGGPTKWILFGLFAPLAVCFVGFYGYELWRLRRADRLSDERF